MDNPLATNGIRQLLLKLPSEDLSSLATTVTQGLVKCLTLDSNDALIETILRYSPNLVSILRRKIITRDILFQYLHDNKIKVNLPAIKHDLIDKICEFWNYNVSTNIGVSNTIVSTPYENVDKSKHNLNIEEMACQFTNWFYTMMNSEIPIGTEHFWQDAKLKLRLLSDTSDCIKEVEGIEDIVQVLYKTKCEHNLCLNPNISNNGTQGRMDPHGLVVIVTCGTLHSNSYCVGIFEQQFMLARDPYSENNWKIKRTELNLRSKENVSVPPQLCDSNLSSSLSLLSH